jgi:hypothetical protein
MITAEVKKVQGPVAQSRSKKEGIANLEELRALRGRQFLEGSIEYYRKTLEAIGMRIGIDLTDYSLESLRAIDTNCLESAEEACRQEGIPPLPGVIWSMYHGVGSYLGTTIVRNLGGDWLIPSTLRLWVSSVLSRPRVLFDHWYVIVKGERIPVFKIARWRCDGSRRVRSLVQVYERIAAGKTWFEEP